MTTTRPTQVTIDAYGLTDTGKVRKENEDHFLVADVSKRVDMLCGSLSLEALNHRVGTSGAQLLVVADGVGGGPDGDLASERTAAAVLTYVGKTAGCFRRAPSRRWIGFMPEDGSISLPRRAAG